ncbi:MAG: ABC transporter permease [Rhodocyclaceae bacterium]|nr:ABC transporter permease [Rhodocyclaceae bacterium]
MVRLPALERKLLRDLWRLRGHLAAVALVTACGVATWVTMRSAYEGMLEARERYYTRWRFADVFAELRRAPASLATRAADLPGVAAVQARTSTEAQAVVPGFHEPVTVRLVALPDPPGGALNDVFVRSGRRPLRGAADEVLAAEGFASAHGLRPGDSLEAVINGRWQRLRVTGTGGSPEYVHVIGGAGVFPDDLRYGVLWMDGAALAAALDMRDGFNALALALAPGADAREVIARLDTLLVPWGSPGGYGRDEQVSHQMLDGEIQQDRVTGVVVPTLFLAVAAFLIHNVLARLIALQRAQIGVLKAFGYGNGRIALHYLELGLAAVLAGGIAGLLLGLWLGAGLAGIYQRFFHFPELVLRVSAANAAGALAVCVAAAGAGAWPAVRRALALAPAESMRAEPPPQFRPRLLERLGLHRRLPPTARMVLRNLERRPLRAAASVTAVALACALLVVGRFGIDALEETVRVQFREARRDDVRVAFREALSPEAARALGSLPGVLQVEGIRVAAARLRHGHRSKRVAVFGLAPGAELHRIVDADGRTVALPAEGVVLSRSLARVLGIAPGDTLVAEFLEGERRVRELPVVATVDESVGLGVYASREALSRWLGEGPRITDAYLRVDALQLDALHARLRQIPAISGVTLREATIATFLDTIARNLRISIDILMVFACAIAAGVVYNGARIALSEHAATLASLRVLGFRRGEVTTILLGEQGLLTAAGIPLGLLVGYGLCGWLAALLETDYYRLPLTLSGSTIFTAAGAVAAAAVASGALVAWRVRHLDLVAVLKTRE